MSVRVCTPADGSGRLSFAYGDGTEYLTRGQLIEVDPGSPLETAIGTANLSPLTGQDLVSDQQGGGGGISN